MVVTESALFIYLFIFTLLIPCARFGVLAQKCGVVNEKLRVENRQLQPPNVATSVSRMLGCLSTINL